MTNAASPTYRLSVLGTRDLVGPDGRRIASVLAQPKRLCLLTYLALSPRPVARATIAALFWPESNETRARNALSQAVHYLRKSLDPGAVESLPGDLIRVAPERVWCDARDLLCGSSVTAEMADAARGDVLEGWNADDSQGLQEWLDGVRRDVKRIVESREDMAAVPEPPSGAPTPSVGVRQAATDSGEVGGRASIHSDASSARASDPAAQARAASGTVSPPTPASGSETPDRSDSVDRSEPASRGGKANPHDPPSRSDAASFLHRLGHRRLAVGAGFVVAALAMAVALYAFGTEAAPLPVEVVMITPQLHSVEGAAPPYLADAIRLEIAAAVSAVPGVVVRTSSAPSAQEARRQMETVGEPKDDKWVLEVLTTVAPGNVRMLIFMDGAGQVHGNRFETVYVSQKGLLMVIPAELGAHVARMLQREVLGRTPSRAAPR